MNQPNPGLAKEFDKAMFGILESAKGLDPPLSFPGFLSMLSEHGGKETADRLLATKIPSDGFTKLYLHGRGESLKLAVEYLVLQYPWRQLFTEDQLGGRTKAIVRGGMRATSGRTRISL